MPSALRPLSLPVPEPEILEVVNPATSAVEPELLGTP